MKILIKLLKHPLILIFAFSSQFIFAQKMPETVNQVYAGFCNAVKSKDLAAYEKVLTVASFIRQKNEALSYGINYPADLFEMLNASMFELKDMTYIGYKQVGPTMNAFYLYDFKLEKMIVTVCLEEHDSKFRIDQMKMRDARDFIKEINEKDYSFINEKEFLPSGTLKPVPVEVKKVEVMAMLDVTCYGYRVEVVVNGISQDEVTDKSRSGVLIGGILRGENKIEMKIEKINAEEIFAPTIAIRAEVNGQEMDVFKFEEKTESGTIVKSFEFK